MQEGRNGVHQARISMVLPAFCSTICTCGHGNTCSTGALTAFSTSRACWISSVVVPWAASTSRWPPASRERHGNSRTCAPSLLSQACNCFADLTPWEAEAASPCAEPFATRPILAQNTGRNAFRHHRNKRGHISPLALHQHLLRGSRLIFPPR